MEQSLKQQQGTEHDVAKPGQDIKKCSEAEKRAGRGVNRAGHKEVFCCGKESRARCQQ